MEFIPQFFSSSPLGRIGIVTLKDRRAHSKGNQFLFHYYEYLKKRKPNEDFLSIFDTHFFGLNTLDVDWYHWDHPLRKCAVH